MKRTLDTTVTGIPLRDCKTHLLDAYMTYIGKVCPQLRKDMEWKHYLIMSPRQSQSDAEKTAALLRLFDMPDNDDTPLADLEQMVINSKQQGRWAEFPRGDSNFSVHNKLAHAFELFENAMRERGISTWSLDAKSEPIESLKEDEHVIPLLTAILIRMTVLSLFRFPQDGTMLIAALLQMVKNQRRTLHDKNSYIHHFDKKVFARVEWLHTHNILSWNVEKPWGKPQPEIEQKRQSHITQALLVILYCRNIDPLPKYSTYIQKVLKADSYPHGINVCYDGPSIYLKELICHNILTSYRETANFPDLDACVKEMIQRAEALAKQDKGETFLVALAWELKCTFS